MSMVFLSVKTKPDHLAHGAADAFEPEPKTSAQYPKSGEIDTQSTFPPSSPGASALSSLSLPSLSNLRFHPSVGR